MADDMTCEPVTRERWPDLERLFSASAGESLGNPSRCWCMEQRLRDRDQWVRNAGEGNRRAMQAHIDSGEVPGILAYDGAEPVGWCSVAPRAGLVGLHEMGSFKHPERPDVWSVSCFYVPRQGQGIMKGLVRAALRYALEAGAAIVEGYPVEPGTGDDGAGGAIPAFSAAGFVEVARPSEHQAVMRYFA